MKKNEHNNYFGALQMTCSYQSWNVTDTKAYEVNVLGRNKDKNGKEDSTQKSKLVLI